MIMEPKYRPGANEDAQKLNNTLAGKIIAKVLFDAVDYNLGSDVKTLTISRIVFTDGSSLRLYPTGLIGSEEINAEYEPEA